MNNIQFLDLKKINDRYREEFISASQRVFDSGWFVNGLEVESFETEFAQYCGARYCIGTGNGLDALTIVLKAWIELGLVNTNDEVIVPGNTFIASALAVTQAGLTPVFTEPHPHSFNLTVQTIDDVRTEKTRVIMPVHLYGQLAPMDEICEYAKRNNLLVLEDSAQGHGAMLRGQRAGSFGDAAGFSFYPGKNLGALGDAGAITTSCKETAVVARSIGNYGSKQKYIHQYQGVNSRLDELQAAFLRVKLRYLDEEIASRQNIAKQYDRCIVRPDISLPQIASGHISSHVYHLYVIKTDRRDALQAQLTEQGIQTLIHYPIPVPQQGAYSEHKFENGPITCNLAKSILSLPIGSHLNQSDVEYIYESINGAT